MSLIIGIGITVENHQTSTRSERFGDCQTFSLHNKHTETDDCGGSLGIIYWGGMAGQWLWCAFNEF